MTLSMTAFARHDQETVWGDLVWELRSVNHRYLELSLRLPEEWRSLEPQVRELVGKQLARGKVDISLRFKPRESAADLVLDETLIGQLSRLGARVVALAPGSEPLRTADYLRWPGALKTPDVDQDTLNRAAIDGLTRALAELTANRAREGARLGVVLADRLSNIEKVLAGLKQVLPEIVPAYRTRLAEKLAELKQQANSERLEQEIVLFAQRVDVQEEVDRLEAHIAETRRALSQSGQIGRRIDFLMQEFNREANTLASKSTDLRQTNAAVELKVLIEQMREQVQNIE